MMVELRVSGSRHWTHRSSSSCVLCPVRLLPGSGCHDSGSPAGQRVHGCAGHVRAADSVRQEPGRPDPGEEAAGWVLQHAGSLDQEPCAACPHPLPHQGCPGAAALAVGASARDAAGERGLPPLGRESVCRHFHCRASCMSSSTCRCTSALKPLMSLRHL